MAITCSCKCKHPKLIRNKYTGQEVFVSCQKCIPCRRARQSAWNAKMQREANCHLYEFEVYLDYDDPHLPKYDFSSNGPWLEEVTPRLKRYYEKYPNLKRIFYKDLNFLSDADYNYFVDRLNSHRTCIPHASVYDIQKFKKRINTYIKREITGKYQNFRSVFVSELGGATFRPHVHGVLYFDDQRIAEKINELVCRSWRDEGSNPLGHAYASPSRGKLSSYIAKYITLPTDLPSFYAHSSLRPFLLSSRCPPIGSLLQSQEKIRKIFDSAAPRKIEFVKCGELWSPKQVSIGQNIENRLFPKCLSYSQISDFDKRFLYKIAIINNDVPPYKVWLSKLFKKIFIGESFGKVCRRWSRMSIYDSFDCARNLHLVNFDSSYLATLVQKVTRDLDRERSLLSLYGVSSRVFHQAKVFDVDVDLYIDKILQYHNVNKPQFVLRNFYLNQNEVLKTYSDYDVRSFYPLTYFRDNVDPSKQVDSFLYHQDIEFKYRESLKNKEASEYREKKLKYNDPVLYNLINKYYAEKCNEDIEAITNAW